MNKVGRLAGLTVMVTRPAHQADQFCGLIEQAGGKALRFPVIEITDVGSPQRLDQQISKLKHCDFIIFISSNAADMGLPKLDRCIETDTRIAAIGKKTAEVIQSHGYRLDIVPEQGVNSESLLDHPAFQQLQGKHIAIVRGGKGRELLETSLRDRGANITLLDVYRRSIPKHGEDLQSILQQTDVIAITSNEGLQNLLTMADSKSRQYLLHIPLLAGSQRVLVLASELGFQATCIQAESPADQAMLEALLMWVESGEHNSV